MIVCIILKLDQDLLLTDQTSFVYGRVTGDIARYLKGPTNKLRYVTVLFTKTTRIHSERILAVSPEILHTERDELAPLYTNVLRDVIVQFFP